MSVPATMSAGAQLQSAKSNATSGERAHGECPTKCPKPKCNNTSAKSTCRTHLMTNFAHAPAILQLNSPSQFPLQKPNAKASHVSSSDKATPSVPSVRTFATKTAPHVPKKALLKESGSNLQLHIPTTKSVAPADTISASMGMQNRKQENESCDDFVRQTRWQTLI